MKDREDNRIPAPQVKAKPLPVSGSDFCLILFAAALCCLWFYVPLQFSAPTETERVQRPANEPSVRYVKVVFPEEKDRLKVRNQENDLVNDEFPLQTPLPLPSLPPPPVMGEGGAAIPFSSAVNSSAEPFSTEPRIPDIPPLPRHPYSDTFPAIASPAPSVSLSDSLINAGVVFTAPTNQVPPQFSFSAEIAFDDTGRVRMLLVDTMVPHGDFLPWRNALMHATSTNSATGTISYQ